MSAPQLETGFTGDIMSTLPIIYTMGIVFGALVLVWVVGCILSCSYMLMDLSVVRPSRGRTQSQSRGGPTAYR